ncbi:MAG: hypothetical protein HY219_00835 [Candidatus Staskawiczbacteria bacterium]|nr:hypothetical protein [Candidatus Staskawiczbacteria bacterium]
MDKTKIAFFEIEPWEKDYLKSQLKEYDLIFSEEKIDPNNLDKISDINILSPFVYSSVDKKIIDSLKSLKYIATRSTGFDHIDLKFCKKNNIAVSNIPTYGENTVAEHTFALILALSRRIYDSIERTKREDFSFYVLAGFDLKEKGSFGLRY